MAELRSRRRGPGGGGGGLRGGDHDSVRDAVRCLRHMLRPPFGAWAAYSTFDVLRVATICFGVRRYASMCFGSRWTRRAIGRCTRGMTPGRWTLAWRVRHRHSRRLAMEALRRCAQRGSACTVDAWWRCSYGTSTGSEARPRMAAARVHQSMSVEMVPSVHSRRVPSCVWGCVVVLGRSQPRCRDHGVELPRCSVLCGFDERVFTTGTAVLCGRLMTYHDWLMSRAIKDQSGT